MTGIQRTLVLRFLEWMESQNYKVYEAGTRPPIRKSSEELLNEYGDDPSMKEWR